VTDLGETMTMEGEIDGVGVFKRAIFPFFLGGWLFGIGFGNLLTRNEYMSLVLIILGAALGIYSGTYLRGYRIDIIATKLDE
jgi:ABC-type phosphate transport system permease subunit